MSGLYTVNNGQTMHILDLNQVINALQQPSGGQETGNYTFQQPGYTNGALISMYIMSRSRNSTPVSVTVSTSSGSLHGMQHSVCLTNFITSDGFQLYNNTSGSQGNPVVSGSYTIQY